MRRASASSSACTTRARSGSPTCSDPAAPEIRKFAGVGKQPYDGLITPDGRYYIAGLFGEDGLALLDLWDLDKGVQRILDGYGRGEEPLPVYKMPHLEGWASAGDVLFLPAVGHHELLVVDRRSWQEVGAHSPCTASRCSRSRGPTAARSGSTSPIPLTTWCR